MIDCVSISTNHLFAGNPIYEQHRLRHECIVQRQSWNVPTIRNMEYDQYDNPAASYLVWRDNTGKARGSSRLYPTDRPYMVQEVFPQLVSNISMPKSQRIWEGTRFCVDSRPAAGDAQADHTGACCRLSGIRARSGHKPLYWRHVPGLLAEHFHQNGWDVEFLGEPHKSEEGHKIIAGRGTVSRAVLEKVRIKTGIREAVLYYGEEMEYRRAA